MSQNVKRKLSRPVKKSRTPSIPGISFNFLCVGAGWQLHERIFKHDGFAPARTNRDDLDRHADQGFDPPEIVSGVFRKIFKPPHL